MKVSVKSNLGAIIDSQGRKKPWVAKQVGATHSQVVNWCRNVNGQAHSTPNVGYLLRLEKVLGVETKDMFEEVEVGVIEDE
jgi:hypothetical protein